jgi:hypothetical protein
MRRPAALILMASLLAIPFANPVFGVPLEDTVAAYDRGNYATAFRLLKPLAEQVYANVQATSGSCTQKAKAYRRTTTRL